MVQRLGIQNPHRLYKEPSFLTNAIARGIRLLDQNQNLTEEEREDQKDLLFQVKRIVQINMGRQRTIGSSKRLRTGREVRVTSDGSEWYDTVVTSNIEDVLGVEYPLDERNQPVRWGKGTKIKVALVTNESEKMYTFDSRVVGVSRSKGVTSLLIAHSDQIEQIQNRQYPRRTSDRPVFFWPVAVVTVGTGKQQKRQAVISNQRRGYGRLEDISAGGCAIRTTGPLKAGTLIKIQFETPDGTRLAVFGKVLSTDRGRARYMVMHVKFTRVSRKNLNKIQAYVYGLVEDDEEVIS
jgi:c-di-GMP-binding flagellar brake protein YcgR